MHRRRRPTRTTKGSRNSPARHTPKHTRSVSTARGSTARSPRGSTAACSPARRSTARTARGSTAPDTSSGSQAATAGVHLADRLGERVEVVGQLGHARDGGSDIGNGRPTRGGAGCGSRVGWTRGDAAVGDVWLRGGRSGLCCWCCCGRLRGCGSGFRCCRCRDRACGGGGWRRLCGGSGASGRRYGWCWF